MSQGDLTFDASTCQRAAIVLTPGDRLVLVAVNPKTGHTGIARVAVPPTQTLDPSAPDCATANGGVVQTLNSDGQPVALSRCVQQQIGIPGDIVLYPPEIDLRVARRRTDLGVPSARAPTLIRSGGQAATDDAMLQVTSHWRVRYAKSPAVAPGDADAGLPPNRPSAGAAQASSLDDYLARGLPLEVPCTELPATAPSSAVAR